MKNLTNLFTLNGKTATQSVGLAPKTYARAKALATELNCKIDFVDHNFLKVTAPTVKIAKQFENTIQSEYDITSALYAEAKAQKSSTSKPTATKGKKAETVTVVFNGVEYKVNQADLVPTQAPKTTSSTKKSTKTTDSKKSTTSPKKAKGNSKSTLENFVLNNPSCTRAEALAHGFSGTKSELALLKKSLGVR